MTTEKCSCQSFTLICFQGSLLILCSVVGKRPVLAWEHSINAKDYYMNKSTIAHVSGPNPNRSFSRPRWQRLRRRRATGMTCFIALLGFVSTLLAQVNVTQHHNHLSRDGLYIDPAFTHALAAGLTRDTAFEGSITGNVYAQPLYIEGGPRGRGVVIAVTESNNIYALDAINGSIVWQTNVGPAVPSGVLPCGNVQPVGISGTPVVDLPSRSLFFDAMSMSDGTPRHYIYSLNVDTGNLNPGWPVDVDASAVSTYGVSTSLTFNSLAQGERGALTVIGTNLYVPYGGLYGDCGSYHGWIVGVPMSNPSQVMAWATPANGGDRKSTRLNSSHFQVSRMPSSA